MFASKSKSGAGRAVFTRTRIIGLVESALFIALAFVLSGIVLFPMPQGGAVTPLSMLPILLIGLRRGPYFGFASALVYSGLQMLQGFYAPPTRTFFWFLLVVLLDYVLAFGVLGLSSLFRRVPNQLLVAIPLCLGLRFLCHFLSGIVIWGESAGDLPVWLYSLVYNGSYMGVELLVTFAVGLLIQKRFASVFLTVKT